MTEQAAWRLQPEQIIEMSLKVRALNVCSDAESWARACERSHALTDSLRFEEESGTLHARCRSADVKNGEMDVEGVAKDSQILLVQLLRHGKWSKTEWGWRHELEPNRVGGPDQGPDTPELRRKIEEWAAEHFDHAETKWLDAEERALLGEGEAEGEITYQTADGRDVTVTITKDERGHLVIFGVMEDEKPPGTTHESWRVHKARREDPPWRRQ